MGSREASLQRLRDAAAARQRFLDMMYAKTEAEEAQRKAEADQAESDKKLNWFDDASKGAMYGSAAGPWGTLIGAAAGTMYGQYQAMKERKKQGQNWWQAFGNTIGDTPFGFNVGAATIPGAGDGDFSWKDATPSFYKMYANRDQMESEGHGSLWDKGANPGDSATAAANTKGAIERNRAEQSAAADEKARNQAKLREMESLGLVSRPRARMDQSAPRTSYSEYQIRDPNADFYGA
jgi:hypothetical protein